MSGNRKVSRMMIPIMALLVLVGAADASAQCAPKVDNFIIFVDQSGSMYATYEKAKAVKMAVAKQILADMNALIPDLGYKGALNLFAPFQELQAPAVYNRVDLAAAIKPKFVKNFSLTARNQMLHLRKPFQIVDICSHVYTRFYP